MLLISAVWGKSVLCVLDRHWKELLSHFKISSVTVGFIAIGSNMNCKCSGNMRKKRPHVTDDCFRIQPFQIWQNMKTSWRTQWLISLSIMDRLQSIPCSSGLTKALMMLFKGAGAGLDPWIFFYCSGSPPKRGRGCSSDIDRALKSHCIANPISVI